MKSVLYRMIVSVSSMHVTNNSVTQDTNICFTVAYEQTEETATEEEPAQDEEYAEPEQDDTEVNEYEENVETTQDTEQGEKDEENGEYVRSSAYEEEEQVNDEGLQQEEGNGEYEETAETDGETQAVGYEQDYVLGDGNEEPSEDRLTQGYEDNAFNDSAEDSQTYDSAHADDETPRTEEDEGQYEAGYGEQQKYGGVVSEGYEQYGEDARDERVRGDRYSQERSGESWE